MLEDNHNRQQARRQSVSSAAELTSAGVLESSSQPASNKARRSLFSILFSPKSSKPAAKSAAEDTISESNSNAPEQPPTNEANETTKRNKNNNDDDDDEDDTDSYVLDLNDRLAIEKLYRFNPARQFHDMRQPQPIDEAEMAKKAAEERKKQQQQQQAPSMMAIRTPRPTLATESGRTCLLEPRLDSLGLSSDEEDEDDEDDDDDDNDDSDEESSKEDNDVASQSSGGGGGGGLGFEKDFRQPVRGIDISMSEQDERLFKWRLLAARTAWAAGSPISSDSELELLDCQAPALAITCSDDTSCSSVELVWSPRAAGLARSGGGQPLLADEQQQQQQPRRPPLTKAAAPAAAASEHQVELAAAPAAAKQSAAAAASTGFLANFNGRQRSIRQKLNIFELAKPMRAKNKQTPSPSQWVANPLFANGNDDDGHEFIDNDNDGRENPTAAAAIDGGSKGSLVVAGRLDSPSASSVQLAGGIGEDGGSRGGSRGELKLAALKAEKTTVRDRIRGKRRWSSIRIRGNKYNLRGERKEPNGGDELDDKRDDDDDEDEKRKSSPETGSLKQRDNIYLNHILNLDRRIKSNVSLLRSQLSETSKRASVLADQLISSIKDTTKEQLFNHSSSLRKDSPPSSSSSSQQMIMVDSFNDSEQQPPAASGHQARASEQPFSLIYMHQQPVVTRQPRSTGALLLTTRGQHTESAPISLPVATAAAAAQFDPSDGSIGQAKETVKIADTQQQQQQQQRPQETSQISTDRAEESTSSGKNKTTTTSSSSSIQRDELKEEALSKSTSEKSKLKGDMKQQRRKARRRRIRRQINVAPPTSDDSDNGDDEAEPNQSKRAKFKPRVRKVSRTQSLNLVADFRL